MRRRPDEVRIAQPRIDGNPQASVLGEDAIPLHTTEFFYILKLVGLFSFPTKDETIREFLYGKTKEEKHHKNKRRSFFSATLFLLIVLAGLLSRLGIFPLSILATFWRFWPVFLLMALLQIFLHRFKLISLVVLGLGLGLVASIIIYSTSSISSTSSNYLRNFYLSMSKVTNFLPIDPGNKLKKSDSIGKDVSTGLDMRQINITLDAGKISVKDSESEDNISINSTFYEKIGAPVISTNTTNDKLVINFTSQFDLAALLGGVEDLSYDIVIGNPKTATDLNLLLGAIKMDVELAKLKVNNLNLDMGAGLANIDLSNNNLPSGNTDIKVNAGILNMKLPFRSFVKINYNIVAGRLRVNEKMLRGSGSYTTTNFKVTTDPKIINLTLDAGDVLIDTRGGE